MPVDFDGSADFIQFADNALYDDLPLKSIFLRTTLEGNGNDTAPRLLWKTPAASGNGWSILYSIANDLFGFIQTASGDTGFWTTTTTFTSGTLSIGVSMDIGNINNAAVVYINGIDETSETTAATGAFDSDAGDGLHVGKGGDTDTNYYEGKIFDIHLANVIWTAAEFASLHASTAPGLWMRGLIFYAPMNGAAGKTAFDTATLGAANKVIDIVSGLLGTPTSDPLGVADTTLAF